MANPIELITAPGKYEYDLAMEELEIELKKSTPVYNSKSHPEKNYKPKDNSYNITKK
jgi:hypothetical protein